MCSQSVSGSSLISGYDEDDLRETSGRSKREFEQIDAVLYDEEVAKRSSIKKICEEWLSKPHFRIRGHLCTTNFRPQDLNTLKTRSNTLSSIDLLLDHSKLSSTNFNRLNGHTDDTNSGRSSVNSIEGSQLSHNSDLDSDDQTDDADATNTTLVDRSNDIEADSFDTDEDEDENAYYSSDTLKPHRTKHPQLSIKCLKDSIVKSLAFSLLQTYFTDEHALLQRYAKYVCAKNSIRVRPKQRPSSSPIRSSIQNRSTTSTNAQLQPNPMTLAQLRATPDSNIKLTDILLVKGLQGAKSNPYATVASSPRKSQISVSNSLIRTERTSTSLSIDKRNPKQQISLIGTAIVNMPLPLNLSTQSSQTQIRQISTMKRYDSTTTLNSNAVSSSELITRLPPIPTDHVVTNDSSSMHRSNTMSTTIIESVPATTTTTTTTRVVSGKSAGSNFSVTKIRTHNNVGKLQRSSKSITISSNKDFNNSPSISPTHLITKTGISSTTLKTTSIARTQQQHQQQQQKKSLITAKSPTPSCSSSSMKLSATHIC